MADFIGGEFWYAATYHTSSVNIQTEGMIFLNGGEAALRLICDHLLSHGVREILVPAYMCPTVIDAFDRYGLTYTFYLIQNNFRIDLNDLRQKLSNFKTLYIINYFGFGFNTDERALLNQLKTQGMLIIEDDAQAGFNRNPIGQLRFNSLRKIAPYDGSFFYADRDMSQSLNKFIGLPNHRLPIIRQYRQTFADLLNSDAESFEELNPLFEQSESYYYADLTVLGDSDERRVAERLDWRSIESARKANHRRLCEQLINIPEIEIIFPQVSIDSLPLGCPIYVKNNQRDALLNYLRENHVYPIVHWDILKDQRINNIPQIVAMSSNIITLIIDQRFNAEDMDYQAGVIQSFFRR